MYARASLPNLCLMQQQFYFYICEILRFRRKCVTNVEIERKIVAMWKIGNFKKINWEKFTNSKRNSIKLQEIRKFCQNSVQKLIWQATVYKSPRSEVNILYEMKLYNMFWMYAQFANWKKKAESDNYALVRNGKADRISVARK